MGFYLPSSGGDGNRVLETGGGAKSWGPPNEGAGWASQRVVEPPRPRVAAVRPVAPVSRVATVAV